ESGRKQPPPLPLLNQGTELRACLENRESRCAILDQAGKFLRQIEARIDQQDQDGGESRMRNQPTQQVGGCAASRGGRLQLYIAIRADLVTGGDEGAAVGAHPAGFHALIVIKRGQTTFPRRFVQRTPAHFGAECRLSPFKGVTSALRRRTCCRRASPATASRRC